MTTLLKRLTIQHVDPVSAGKVGGLISIGLGIIIGIFMGAVMALGDTVNQSGTGSAAGAMLGGFAFIMSPLICGAGGFLSGMALAMLHNLVVSWTGGLVMEVVDESEDDEDE